MRMLHISFDTTDWQQVESTKHAGTTGMAYWRTREFSGIRVRMVEYTPGYLADTGVPRAISYYAWRANWKPNWRMAEGLS